MNAYIIPGLIRKTTPKMVAELVANTYGISMEEITGDRRFREYSVPRQVALYLLDRHTKVSRKEMLTFFKRDRSIMPHTIRSVSDQIEIDKTFRERIEKLVLIINTWTYEGRIKSWRSNNSQRPHKANESPILTGGLNGSTPGSKVRDARPAQA